MSGLWFELVRCLFLLRVLSALLCIGSVCIVVHWLKCKLGKAGIPVHKMARGPWPRRAGSCPRSSTRPPSRGHGPRALGDLRASSSFHSFHFVVSFMNLRSKTCTSDMASAAHRSHRSRTATKSSWSRRNSGQPKRANAMVWQSSLVQTGPCHYDRGQCPAPGCAPPGAVRQFPCGSTGSTVAMSSSHARAPGFPRSRSDALSGRARSNRQLKSELSAQIATAKMFGHVILSMLCVYVWCREHGMGLVVSVHS